MEANLSSEAIAAAAPRRGRLRSLLHRFKRRRGTAPAAVPEPAQPAAASPGFGDSGDPPDAADPALLRARAALNNARTLMPGLLDASKTLPAGSGSLLTLTPAAAPYAEQMVATPGVARLEEAILRLEDERRQLSAEVMALRMAVDELRETLLQLDEQRPPPRQIQIVDAEPLAQPANGQAKAALASADAAGAASGPTDLMHPEAPGAEAGDRRQAALESTRPSQDTESLPEFIYPAGSVGLRLCVRPVSDPARLDALHRALTSAPEVESVRLQHYEDGEASLRIYLRLPAARRRLIALLDRAVPGVEPLPETAAGEISVQFR